MSPRAGWLVGACLALGTAATPAEAGPRPPRLEIGVVSGWTKPDDGLADYQWDTTPSVAWGAQALIGARAGALGLRFTSTGTTQSLGSGASVPETAVNERALELVAQGNVFSTGATRVYGSASVGRLHLGYDPDRVTIDVSGSGPVDVALAPIDTWMWGGGLGVERSLGRVWTGGLEVTHRAFALETAHRNGDAIEFGRRSFGEWGARFVLGWRFGS